MVRISLPPLSKRIALRPFALLLVRLTGAHSDEYIPVAYSSLRHTYFTIAQMMAHHSATGCPLRPGDLLGTGTLSAPHPNGFGSLLERSKNGQGPFPLDARRADMTFLRDGDSVRMTGLTRATVEGMSFCVGFGECEGTVLPALR